MSRSTTADNKDNNSQPAVVVFRDWSPYGSPSPEIQNPTIRSANTTRNNDDPNSGGVIFRGWSTRSSSCRSTTTSSTTVTEADKKLEQVADKLRRQLHELREHGRQVRLHRLQALDALETRRVTLTEILRRMEKELNDRDVFEYGDVLAEVFGERKIYAHRAVGLEALLCQYMHQMLAKQHQLRIMKRAGKDIEGHYRKSRNHIKESYYSYDALCVQLEASRLSLEDIYDDIFASQHRILAQLKHVESGGDMTNYSIPSPAVRAKKEKEATSRKVSSKHTHSDADEETKGLQVSLSEDRSLTDEFVDILASPTNLETMDDERKEEHLIKTAAETAAAIMANPIMRTNTNIPLHPPKSSPVVSTADVRPTTNRRSPDDGKTARERRREIEKTRLAHPSRVSTTSSNNDSASSTYLKQQQEEDAHRARTRMRQLEAKAASTK
ncbi:hypothetical protein IV203_032476 [Nitzschia inconspicua]|uniref:Uncharacterized protein n=1 Tax=Nitzschia inconspicua TaxID=303405 RepID=A0A9K3KJN3_9STRA|nr:hypothetical protein IV203_032476 [Nitzschia inconspicua]